ncbi:hypothetical protein ACIOWI_29685 [Streptomyces sp. NPDC087659]|uniref:hypothetical protein n=1 Tax=Streptomyces sp. NPDC087659 TaxID=3365801 RepID=UPI0037FCE8FB
MEDDPINPDLRRRLEERKWAAGQRPTSMSSQSGSHHRGDQVKGDPDSGALILYWIGYFLIFGGLAWFFGPDL